MADSDIIPPPYPGDMSTVRSVYGYLKQVRSWAIEENRQLRGQFIAQGEDTDALQDPDPLPPYENWFYCSLAQMYMAFQRARELRKAYDEQARQCEEHWDEPHALAARARLTEAARQLLEHAFTNPEHLEAHAQAEQERAQGLMRQLDETMRPQMRQIMEQWHEDPDSFREADDDDGTYPPDHPDVSSGGGDDDDDDEGEPQA